MAAARAGPGEALLHTNHHTRLRPRISWLATKASTLSVGFLLHGPRGNENLESHIRSDSCPGEWDNHRCIIDQARERSAQSAVGRSDAIISVIMVSSARQSVRFLAYAISTHHAARSGSDAALDFYCNKLGLKETRRRVNTRTTTPSYYWRRPEDEKLVEASKKAGRPGREWSSPYNWDTEDYGEARYFGHLASRSRRYLHHLR